MQDFGPSFLVVVAAIGYFTRRRSTVWRLAAIEGWPVMLSMTDNKVYVGLVLVPPGIEPEKIHVRILPTLSGWRRENRTVEFTTKYQDLYGQLTTVPAAELDIEDFGIVLPLSQILSARRFEADVYDSYFSGERPAIASTPVV